MKDFLFVFIEIDDKENFNQGITNTWGVQTNFELFLPSLKLFRVNLTMLREKESMNAAL